MQTRRLGRNGPEISALGLGCMAMSGTYGPAVDAESIATVHAALDAGITMLDTGDFYGMGHNEMLLRQALDGGRRERVFLAVKFGAQLADLLGALDLDLSAADLAALERTVPPGAAAGDRYNPAGMAGLDSERGSQSSCVSAGAHREQA